MKEAIDTASHAKKNTDQVRSVYIIMDTFQYAHISVSKIHIFTGLRNYSHLLLNLGFSSEVNYNVQK